MNNLDLKEGQTYVCTNSERPWWTVGKEYKVVLNANNQPVLSDDEGDGWCSKNLNGPNGYFKLKEQSFDLNKLTVYQLKEYIDLQQALEFAEKEVYLKLAKKEVAKSELDEFIERMTK